MKIRIVLITAGFFILSWNSAFSTGNNFNDYINAKDDEQSNAVKNMPHTTMDNDQVQTHSDESNEAEPSNLIPADWQRCAMDSDCTAAVTDCVSWRGINKDHLKDISVNLNSCTAAVDPGFQPQSSCVRQKCRTTNKDTGVSWEEWLNQMKEECKIKQKN